MYSLDVGRRLNISGTSGETAGRQTSGMSQLDQQNLLLRLWPLSLPGKNIYNIEVVKGEGRHSQNVRLL